MVWSITHGLQDVLTLAACQHRVGIWFTASLNFFFPKQFWISFFFNMYKKLSNSIRMFSHQKSIQKILILFPRLSFKSTSKWVIYWFKYHFIKVILITYVHNSIFLITCIIKYNHFLEVRKNCYSSFYGSVKTNNRTLLVSLQYVSVCMTE